MPECLAVAVVPRIKPFVAALGELFADAGFLGDFFDEALVDELSAQMPGKVMSELSAPAAVFPLHCNQANHSSFLLDPSPMPVSLLDGS